MRDVAGMLRSFEYAAATVRRDSRLSESGSSQDKAEDLLNRFREISSAGLLAGYAEGRGGTLAEAEEMLLDLHLLEKAAYEVTYEAANRPTWVDVPIAGLTALADRLLGRPVTSHE
jgi:maltose alpha-D-glucosyltransferase/alpha-amylase